MDNWPIWLVGVVVLVVAGVASVVMVRNRVRRSGRDDAFAGARAALAAAEVSRDACPRQVPAAEALYQQAVLIVAGSRGAAAADRAAELAGQADRLWQRKGG